MSPPSTGTSSAGTSSTAVSSTSTSSTGTSSAGTSSTGMVSGGWWLPATLALALGLFVLSTPAAAQVAVPDVDSLSLESTIVAVVGAAVTTFLTTLVVGGLLAVLAPDYTASVTAELRDRPVPSFLYGLVTFVFLFLAIIVLFFTVIGVLVAVPLMIATAILVAIGASLGYLAIGYAAVGDDEGYTRPLLVGAALAGVLTLLPFVGALISFGVSAAGFGAVFRRLNGD